MYIQETNELALTQNDRFYFLKSSLSQHSYDKLSRQDPLLWQLNNANLSKKDRWRLSKNSLQF